MCPSAHRMLYTVYVYLVAQISWKKLLLVTWFSETMNKWIEGERKCVPLDIGGGLIPRKFSAWENSANIYM